MIITHKNIVISIILLTGVLLISDIYFQHHRIYSTITTEYNSIIDALYSDSEASEERGEDQVINTVWAFVFFVRNQRIPWSFFNFFRRPQPFLSVISQPPEISS